MHPVIVVHFQPLLCQAIDSRSRPRHVCLASGPHARMSLLAVADGGQPQPHRFHPPVPVLDPALTDVPVGRLPRFGLVTCGGPDAQRWGNLGNRGGKALSWPCAVAPRRRHWLGPSVPSWGAPCPPRVELHAPRALGAQHDGGYQQGSLPVVWSLAAVPQAHPGRPVGAQCPLVPGQPVRDGQGATPLESTAESPGHHSMGENVASSLRALTPWLVHRAEPGKNKIWE